MDGSNLPTMQMPPNIPEKGNFFQNPLTKIAIALILVVVAIFLLSYFKILSIPQLSFLPQKSYTNQPSSIPQSTLPPKVETNLESCSVTKEGNPLVSEVKKLPDGTIIGTFLGNINKVDFSSDKLTASIEVISPQGDQTHIFKLKDEKGLIYDGLKLKDLSLSDLAEGQTVIISFNCFPDKDNLFKIAQVKITGRLK